MEGSIIDRIDKASNTNRFTRVVTNIVFALLIAFGVLIFIEYLRAKNIAKKLSAYMPAITTEANTYANATVTSNLLTLEVTKILECKTDMAEATLASSALNIDIYTAVVGLATKNLQNKGLIS